MNENFIITERFEELKKSEDSEKINDFLIELANNMQIEYLTFLDYIIENFSSQAISKIKLNLVYNIGELGKLSIINNKFVKFLVKEYYNSDRWIRLEIITALNKISLKQELTKTVIELVGRALNEDYMPIKINSLNILTNMNDLSDSVLKNTLNILNLSDLKLIEKCSNILIKNIHDENQLFDFLYRFENYKNLKKKGVRSLLIIFFNSEIALKRFREKILKSDMETNYKEAFFSEIDTYEKILLKSSFY